MCLSVWFVAVDNDENDDYDVMLMVFYPRLLAESAIYPHCAALTACPAKLSLRYITLSPTLIIKHTHPTPVSQYPIIGPSIYSTTMHKGKKKLSTNLYHLLESVKHTF